MSMSFDDTNSISSKTASAVAAIRGDHQKNDNNNMTPQMLILGRDGRDLEQSRGHHELLRSEDDEKKENKNNRSSWLNVLNFRTNNNSNKALDGTTTTTNAVASSKDPSSSQKNNDDGIVVSEKTRRLSRKKLFQSIPTTLPDNVDDDEIHEKEQPSEEDAVRQDCSFFYRDMDEDTYYYRHRRRQQGTAFSTTTDTTAPPNPRARAAYRARFQQLNGCADGEDDEDYYDDDTNNIFHDLWLEEDADVPSSMPILPSRLSDISKSSLCWYNQDGKILMRLPKENVRLIMDPDLEAGILSVVEDSTTTSNDNKQRNYVLTVDENLYRRVIGEISDGFHTPCHLNQFCIENGRVDISVAICLLSIILVFLLVNTIIWPVN